MAIERWCTIPKNPETGDGTCIDNHIAVDPTLPGWPTTLAYMEDVMGLIVLPEAEAMALYAECPRPPEDPPPPEEP